jgi:2-C-methyl-D-erythritol 4-phosphate cytidylyltransferase
VAHVTTAVVVAAAGRGERLGPGAPKALRELAGEPLLVHAVRSLVVAPSVDLVVVAAPADRVSEVRALLTDVVGDRVGLAVVAGGPSRQESVRRALDVLPDEVDVILVHDAARTLVPVALVESVIAAVRAGAGAVVPGLPVADTVKRVGADAVVTETVDRSGLWSIQTPQGFSRVVLLAAHEAASDGQATEATDDAGLVERMGGTVTLVPGSEEAFKVTRPIDLVLAEALLASRRAERSSGR